MQPAVIGRLTDQSVVAGARGRERGGIAPGLLHEAETVLQAALVAGKEKASLVVRMVRKLGSVGDPVSDHTGHFHRVGGGARVDFADVCSERTDEFVDPFVFEVVGGFVFEALDGFAIIVGVIFWVQGDRSSC